MAEIYHLLKRQIPPHVREKNPVFCTFIDYYYRWLQARGFSDLQNITDIDFVNRAITITDNLVPIELFNGQTIVGANGARAIVVGISDDGRLLIRYQTLDAKFSRGETIHIKRTQDDSDKSVTAVVDGVFTIPSVFIDEFSKLLDVEHIFGTDTNNIAQILRHIKELYRSKGTEDALKYLLKINQGVEAEVKYPFEQVLKPSDGKWTQYYAVTLKTHPDYYGKEPTTVSEARFMAYPTKAYMDVGVDHIETFRNDEYLRFYMTEDPTPYEGQMVEVIENNSIVYVGYVVNGYTSVKVLSGGKKWQVGQVFTIGGKDGWGVYELSYDDRERPWHTRNKLTPYKDPFDDYGESGIETYLQHEEKPTICRVTVVDENGAIVHAEIIQLGEYVSENQNKEYVVSPLFFETGEEWEEEYKATITFEFGARHKEVGFWAAASGFLSYQDIRLQDSYYYQQFSYDIVSTANPDTYQNLAMMVHPVGTKMFTTYILNTELNLDETFDIDVTFPFVALSFFDVARITDTVVKFLHKSLTDGVENVLDDILLPKMIKGLMDHIFANDIGMTFQVWKELRDHASAIEVSFFDLKRTLFEDVLSCEEINFAQQKRITDNFFANGFWSFDYKIQDFGDLALPYDNGRLFTSKTTTDNTLSLDRYSFSVSSNKLDELFTSDYEQWRMFKPQFDITAHSEAHIFDIRKPLTDKSSNKEVISKYLNKPLVDETKETTDSVDKVIGLNRGDYYVTTERYSLYIRKPLNDLTNHSEIRSWLLSKPLSDITKHKERIWFDILKPIEDETNETTDTKYSFSIIKPISDGTESSETHTFSLKRSLNDIPQPTDDGDKLLRKSFNDIIAPIDFFSITQHYFWKDESSTSDSLDIRASKVGLDKTDIADATTIAVDKSVEDVASHKELLTFGLNREFKDSTKPIESYILFLERNLESSIQALETYALRISRNLSDGVNSIDDEMMKFVGTNKADSYSTFDGTPTTTASETHNYDLDDSPYFIRSYKGTVNQSFSELGIDYNIDIS